MFKMCLLTKKANNYMNQHVINNSTLHPSSLLLIPKLLHNLDIDQSNHSLQREVCYSETMVNSEILLFRIYKTMATPIKRVPAKTHVQERLDHNPVIIRMMPPIISSN